MVEIIRKEIQDHPVDVSGVSINLTISAGIATAIIEPQEPEEAILAFADQQLYLAKNNGRNRVEAAPYISATPNQKDHADV